LEKQHSLIVKYLNNLAISQAFGKVQYSEHS